MESSKNMKPGQAGNQKKDRSVRRIRADYPPLSEHKEEHQTLTNRYKGMDIPQRTVEGKIITATVVCGRRNDGACVINKQQQA